MCIDQVPNILRWRLVMGFMEPQRISTTLILETDDAISSLDAQSAKVEDCFSCSPSPVRRLFLCGDDIIDGNADVRTRARGRVPVWPLTFTASYIRVSFWGGARFALQLHLRGLEMYSRNKVRRNALNHPGFSSSDSYSRKRSLDSAAWSGSEKRNSHSVREKKNKGKLLWWILLFVALDVWKQSQW